MGQLSFYLDVVSEPAEWSCAHTPVIFECTPQYNPIAAITDDGNGFALVSWFDQQNIPIEVGQMIYIDASQYQGFHTIKEIDLPFQVTLETEYAGLLTESANYAYTPKISFSIYKGYRTGEGNAALRTNLPYTLVADFFIEINTVTLTYKWDVSGFLKSIFTIPEPSAGISYGLFNRWRLVLTATDDILEYYQVGNCAIDNPDFNTDYAQTGAWLSEGTQPTFECGSTLKSKVSGGVIMTYEIVDGEDNTLRHFNLLDYHAGGLTFDFMNKATG